MLSRLFRLSACLVVALLLAGCVSRLFNPPPKQFYYDVRGAMVVAGPKVPLSLVQGVERRLSDSVTATTRSEVLPRVILTVRLLNISPSIGLDRNKNEAEVKVSAASIESGEVIAEGEFKVLTETGSPDLAAESLAEEVSARVRSLFYLERPPAQQSHAEQSPAQQSSTQQPPAHQPPAQQSSTQQPPAHQPPAHQSPAQ